MREVSATGISFLVPAGVLATRRAASFDLAAPPADDNATITSGPQLRYGNQARRDAKRWFIGPSITGTTPASARVELLVRGDPGRRIYLSFEESCGFSRSGGNAQPAAGISGAHGQRALRSPAVMIVPKLTSKRPRSDCYVSGIVVTRGRNDLHISLIDY